MSALRTVVHEGAVMALIRRGCEGAEPGVSFLTPNEYPLQVGILNHPAGTQIKPHVHRDIHYEVNTTQEFIYVESGRIEIILYDDTWDEVTRDVLSGGDFVLFVSGGHSLKVLEESRMVEVKQGPYPGDAHAKVFPEHPVELGQGRP